MSICIYTGEKIWRVDLRRGNQLDDADLGIGEETRRLLISPDRKAGENSLFFLQVRRFYCTLSKYLIDNLPLKKRILQRIQLLLPRKLLAADDTTVSDVIVSLAKQLPSVIRSEELDHLRIEVQMMRATEKFEEHHGRSVGDFWQSIASRKDILGEQAFPLISRLARAALTMFHGNADAERAIGKSHDIDDDSKRNRMSDPVRSAHLRVRSSLVTTGLTCHDFPISKELLQAGFSARARYQAYLDEKSRESKKREQQKAAAEREKQLMEEFHRQRESDERECQLRERERTAAELESEAQKKMVEAEVAMQKIAEKLHKAQAERETAEKLKRQIHSEREAVTKRAMETAVKRQAAGIQTLIDFNQRETKKQKK